MQPIGVSVNVNFLAGLMLFLAARPKVRVMAAACAAGACLGAYLGFHGSLLQRALEALSYCGAGAIPAVWLMPLLGERSDLKLLAKLLFLPCFAILTTVFLNFGSHGLTYDRYLYAFDGSLGFQPSFWAGQALAAPAWMGELTRALYDGLPLFLVAAYVIAERHGAATARMVFLWIVLLGVCGAGCYVLFPAVGTYLLYAKSFPFHAPAVSTVPLVPIAVTSDMPRNCMPSMHTAWALVAIWAAGKCQFPWRWIMRGLLAIMLFQTLAFHYLVDMIVSVPFTLAIFAVVRSGCRGRPSSAAPPSPWV